MVLSIRMVARAHAHTHTRTHTHSAAMVHVYTCTFPSPPRLLAAVPRETRVRVYYRRAPLRAPRAATMAAESGEFSLADHKALDAAKRAVVLVEANVTKYVPRRPKDPEIQGAARGTAFIIARYSGDASRRLPLASNNTVDAPTTLLLMTNNHVMCSERVTILAPHIIGVAQLIGVLVGRNEQYDVALLEVSLVGVHEAARRAFAQLEFSSDALFLSETMRVAAFGFPLGSPDLTISSGTITRILKLARNCAYGIDVAINHGNSGGPLMRRELTTVGVAWRVAGVCFAGVDGTNDVSYAITLPVALTAAREILLRAAANRNSVSGVPVHPKEFRAPVELFKWQPLSAQLRDLLKVKEGGDGSAVLVTQTAPLMQSRLPSIQKYDILFGLSNVPWPYVHASDFTLAVFPRAGDHVQLASGEFLARRPLVQIIVRDDCTIDIVQETRGETPPIPAQYLPPAGRRMNLEELFSIIPYDWPLTPSVRPLNPPVEAPARVGAAGCGDSGSCRGEGGAFTVAGSGGGGGGAAAGSAAAAATAATGGGGGGSSTPQIAPLAATQLKYGPLGWRACCTPGTAQLDLLCETPQPSYTVNGLVFVTQLFMVGNGNCGQCAGLIGVDMGSIHQRAGAESWLFADAVKSSSTGGNDVSLVRDVDGNTVRDIIELQAALERPTAEGMHLLTFMNDTMLVLSCADIEAEIATRGRASGTGADRSGGVPTRRADGSRSDVVSAPELPPVTGGVGARARFSAHASLAPTAGVAPPIAHIAERAIAGMHAAVLASERGMSSRVVWKDTHMRSITDT